MSEVDVQGLQGDAPKEASTTEPHGSIVTTSGSAATTPGSAVTPQAGSLERKKRKSIFVCCDGTGNEFAAKDSFNGNSNVVKLYTALNLNNDHVAYYHPGVGTMGDPTKKGILKGWSMLKGLAFGYGFRDNVLDAYRYLMQHYASGDRVYIFGFSRGAYTARALAGLLHGYGLLCRGNEGHIPYAWRMYTEKLATQKEMNAHTIQTDTTFRDTFSHKDFSIYFVGLWDTVSSVGWIRTPLRLLDLAQNPTIQRGRHAVSIDERRCFYQDNLWGEPMKVNVPVVLQGKAAAEIPKLQDMRQVWFPGVHSDVGGSYPQLQSELSNITLQWMLEETRAASIEHGGTDESDDRTDEIFDAERVRMVLGTPDERLGEPTALTAALAPIYEHPKPFGMHYSLYGIWWLLEIFPHRYYDKDDAVVKKRISLGAYRKIPSGALVHPSILERFKCDGCYRPKNVSSGELVDAPESAGKPRGWGDCYLQFLPNVCRSYKLRESWPVVFVVTVFWFWLPFYALCRLEALAFPHEHPGRIVPFAHRSWVGLGELSQWFSTAGRVADVLWTLLPVTVGVIAMKLIGFYQSRKR